MPVVEISGVATVDFPDSMSEDEIKATIKRKFYAQKATVPTRPVPFVPDTTSNLPKRELPPYKTEKDTTDYAGESLLGDLPEIPSGADTTAPAITIPLSAAAKTARSAVQFATSPKGIAQIAGAATPVAPAIYAKWAYDMLKGGVESVKDAGEAVANLIKGHINRQMAKQLGEQAPPVDQEEVQRLADDAVNTAVGIIGGATAAGGALHPLIKRTAEVAPLTADALQKGSGAFSGKSEVVSSPTAVGAITPGLTPSVKPITPVRTEPLGTSRGSVESAPADLAVSDAPTPPELSKAFPGAKIASVANPEVKAVSAGFADAQTALTSSTESMGVGKAVPTDIGVKGAPVTLPKQLGDLLDSLSFSKQGLKLFDVERGRVMLDSVLDVVKDRQVFDSIINLVPIDMVNALATEKFPADALLNDPTVFVNALSAPANHLVADRFMAFLAGLHKPELTKQLKSGQVYAVHNQAKSVFQSLRPSAEQGVQQVPVSPSVEETSARSPQVSPEKSQAVADYERYQEVQAEVKRAFKAGDQEAFGKAFKENEDIKNRYGGMPPPKPTTTVSETTPPVPPEQMPQSPTQTGLRPAIRLVGGEVVVGDAGKTHPDIIVQNNLKSEEIDQRGFVDEQGVFHDREQSAVKTGLSTEKEQGRLHSTDLPEAKEATPQSAGEQEVKTAPAVEPATMTGAAHISEIPETGVGAEKYGVAERVREERAKAGQVEPVEPGEGVSTLETIKRGRAMLQADPNLAERLMSQFEADPQKALSADAMAVSRAKGEALAAKARTVEERSGTDSDEYRAVKDELSAWDKRSKTMQTEWHKTGMAQQGETDIDTGSFTGLERARRETTGKDFTESQKPKAKKIAAENKKAQQAVDKASDKLNKRIRQKADSDPDRAKVWELAKKYLDENKGLYGFDDLRNQIATDIGMKPEQVTKLLAKDAATKQLADDLWIKQRNARRLKEQAKRWLKELDTPGYVRTLASLPRAMFALSVFGHGFVALGTHAPIVAFQPRFWDAYVRNFGKMYKMVFSPAYYESQMADLVRRPNYERARRAGLQNDPFQYEEFQTSMVRDLVKDWVGEKNMDRVDKFASAGNRGYGVLKLLRQDMFDQKYGKLPDMVRLQKGVTAAMADDINHATGVTKAGAPKGSNLLLFAPRLAGSRVMWIAGDPIRAARTIADWKNATTAERQFAIDQMKEKAWVFGTFASLLAANQGLLTAAGSNQKINGIPESLGGAGVDPLSGDFMKFKALGGNIAYGGALLTLAKLPARVATAILYEGKGSKYVLEDERVDKVIGSYIRSQMSPFAGTVTDLALGRDYEARPLPAKMFGLAEQTGAVPKRLQAIGVDEPYNWAEFAATKLPIPVAEGIKEGLRGSGMSDEQAKYWMKAMAITSLMTATGTRITEDTRGEQ